MVAGDAQIGLTQSLFLNKLLAGEEPMKRPPTTLRAIASLESTAMYFIVDASCPYNTLGELIEAGYKTKVGAMVASAASSIVGEMILQEYGLSGISDLQDSGEVYVADGSALYDAYGDRHFDLLIVNQVHLRRLPEGAAEQARLQDPGDRGRHHRLPAGEVRLGRDRHPRRHLCRQRC